MATENIIPVQLELTSGTYYTLWAPSWREHGEEWQAFLGAGESLYFFTSPAQMLAFLESGTSHDLTSHPKWSSFANKSAEARAVPASRNVYDLVAVPAYLAEKPSYSAVDKVSRNFEFARSLGRVCGLDRVNAFFDNHSLLANVNRGADHYSGDDGLSEWSAVGRTILSNWGDILDEFEHKAEASEDTGSTKAATPADDEERDEVDVSDVTSGVTDDVPSADEEGRDDVFIIPNIALSEEEEEAAIAKAQEEIDKAKAAREEREKEDAAAREKAREEADEKTDPDADPYDSTIWASAGIDPIKIIIDGKTVYTLRCYVDGSPIFLGRFGEIYTFNSGRALARWIVDHKDHDLAPLSTWGEIVDKATVGELTVTVHDANSYVFTGLYEAIKKGPNAVDTTQLGQAYEVIADAADWAGDDAVNSVLLAVPELQEYISYMLGTSSTYLPSEPYDTEADGWKRLEDTLTDRFSKF